MIAEKTCEKSTFGETSSPLIPLYFPSPPLEPAFHRPFTVAFRPVCSVARTLKPYVALYDTDTRYEGEKMRTGEPRQCHSVACLQCASERVAPSTRENQGSPVENYKGRRCSGSCPGGLLLKDTKCGIYVFSLFPFLSLSFFPSFQMFSMCRSCIPLFFALASSTSVLSGCCPILLNLSPIIFALTHLTY